MEEEEHTDRKQQLAMLYQKLNKIKKYLNEGNVWTGFSDKEHLYHTTTPHTSVLVTDDTDNINQVISSNSPESCLSYLTDLEKKGDPHLDHNHLTRLVDFYTRVFSSMPLWKHCENESYARMLVRFAELKVWVVKVITRISSWFYVLFPKNVLIHLPLCPFVAFKISMRLKPTSTLPDLTARVLHLFMLHMHGLNIHKVRD